MSSTDDPTTAALDSIRSELNLYKSVTFAMSAVAGVCLIIFVLQVALVCYVRRRDKYGRLNNSGSRTGRNDSHADGERPQPRSDVESGGMGPTGSSREDPAPTTSVIDTLLGIVLKNNTRSVRSGDGGTSSIGRTTIGSNGDLIGSNVPKERGGGRHPSGGAVVHAVPSSADQVGTVTSHSNDAGHAPNHISGSGGGSTSPSIFCESSGGNGQNSGGVSARSRGTPHNAGWSPRESGEEGQNDRRGQHGPSTIVVSSIGGDDTMPMEASSTTRDFKYQQAKKYATDGTSGIGSSANGSNHPHSRTVSPGTTPNGKSRYPEHQRHTTEDIISGIIGDASTSNGKGRGMSIVLPGLVSSTQHHHHQRGRGGPTIQAERAIGGRSPGPAAADSASQQHGPELAANPLVGQAAYSPNFKSMPIGMGLGRSNFGPGERPLMFGTQIKAHTDEMSDDETNNSSGGNSKLFPYNPQFKRPQLQQQHVLHSDFLASSNQPLMALANADTDSDGGNSSARAGSRGRYGRTANSDKGSVIEDGDRSMPFAPHGPGSSGGRRGFVLMGSSDNASANRYANRRLHILHPITRNVQSAAALSAASGGGIQSAASSRGDPLSIGPHQMALSRHTSVIGSSMGAFGDLASSMSVDRRGTLTSGTSLTQHHSSSTTSKQAQTAIALAALRMMANGIAKPNRNTSVIFNPEDGSGRVVFGASGQHMHRMASVQGPPSFGQGDIHSDKPAMSASSPLKSSSPTSRHDEEHTGTAKSASSGDTTAANPALSASVASLTNVNVIRTKTGKDHPNAGKVPAPHSKRGSLPSTSLPQSPLAGNVEGSSHGAEEDDAASSQVNTNTNGHNRRFSSSGVGNNSTSITVPWGQGIVSADPNRGKNGTSISSQRSIRMSIRPNPTNIDAAIADELSLQNQRSPASTPSHCSKQSSPQSFAISIHHQFPPQAIHGVGHIIGPMNTGLPSPTAGMGAPLVTNSGSVTNGVWAPSAVAHPLGAVAPVPSPKSLSPQIAASPDSFVGGSDPAGSPTNHRHQHHPTALLAALSHNPSVAHSSSVQRTNSNNISNTQRSNSAVNLLANQHQHSSGASLHRGTSPAATATNGDQSLGQSGTIFANVMSSNNNHATATAVNNGVTTSSNILSSLEEEVIMEDIIEDRAKRIVYQLLTKDWQRGRAIGRGSSGVVFQCVLGDGSFIAMKTISTVDSDASSIIHELYLMSHLRSPHIIRYYHAEHDVEAQEICLWMEFVHGGNLAALTSKMDTGAHNEREAKPLNENIGRKYVRQILEAIVYLHTAGIVHRDIKAENVMLDWIGVVKLADFGSARALTVKGKPNRFNMKDLKVTVPDNLEGTLLYMSPECFDETRMPQAASPSDPTTETSSNAEGAACMYEFARDVWALGITAIEILNKGNLPYPSFAAEWEAIHHIASLRLSPKVPQELAATASPECMDFIQQCLIIDVESRPTAAELLHHPWLLELDEEDEMLYEQIKGAQVLHYGDDEAELSDNSARNNTSTSDTGLHFAPKALSSIPFAENGSITNHPSTGSPHHRKPKKGQHHNLKRNSKPTIAGEGDESSSWSPAASGPTGHDMDVNEFSAGDVTKGDLRSPMLPTSNSNKNMNSNNSSGKGSPLGPHKKQLTDTDLRRLAMEEKKKIVRQQEVAAVAAGGIGRPPVSVPTATSKYASSLEYRKIDIKSNLKEAMTKIQEVELERMHASLTGMLPAPKAVIANGIEANTSSTSTAGGGATAVGPQVLVMQLNNSNVSVTSDATNTALPVSPLSPLVPIMTHLDNNGTRHPFRTAFTLEGATVLPPPIFAEVGAVPPLLLSNTLHASSFEDGGFLIPSARDQSPPEFAHGGIGQNGRLEGTLQYHYTGGNTTPPSASSQPVTLYEQGNSGIGATVVSSSDDDDGEPDHTPTPNEKALMLLVDRRKQERAQHIAKKVRTGQMIPFEIRGGDDHDDLDFVVSNPSTIASSHHPIGCDPNNPNHLSSSSGFGRGPYLAGAGGLANSTGTARPSSSEGTPIGISGITESQLGPVRSVGSYDTGSNNSASGRPGTGSDGILSQAPSQDHTPARPATSRTGIRKIPVTMNPLAASASDAAQGIRLKQQGKGDPSLVSSVVVRPGGLRLSPRGNPHQNLSPNGAIGSSTGYLTSTATSATNKTQPSTPLAIPPLGAAGGIRLRRPLPMVITEGDASPDANLAAAPSSTTLASYQLSLPKETSAFDFIEMPPLEIKPTAANSEAPAVNFEKKTHGTASTKSGSPASPASPTSTLRPISQQPSALVQLPTLELKLPSEPSPDEFFDVAPLQL